MLLIESTISELVKFVNLWNDEYTLNMVFYGQHGERIAWTVGNVLVTGIEIAPGRVLYEFDNFDLQGANSVAKRTFDRLHELLHGSFAINDTPDASRIYGIMARQAERVKRGFPPYFADTSLDAETEAKFKSQMRKKNPDITEEEVSEAWRTFCQVVEGQKAKREKQTDRKVWTAEQAAEAWLGVEWIPVEAMTFPDADGSNEKLFVIRMTKPQFERALSNFVNGSRLLPLTNWRILRRRRTEQERRRLDSRMDPENRDWVFITNVAEADAIKLTSDPFRGLVLELTEKEAGLWVVVNSEGDRESITVREDDTFRHKGYKYIPIDLDGRNELLTWLEGLEQPDQGNSPVFEDENAIEQKLSNELESLLQQKENTEGQITTNLRVLAILKNQRAMYTGLYVPPHIVIQIEDIETENERLHTELAEIEAKIEALSSGAEGDHTGPVNIGSVPPAQATHSSHAEVNTSTVDQHGQQVWGGQYNAARDININYSQPAARPQLPPPFQIPPPTEHFTGRETELARLLDELQPGHVATLCGPGGRGKTALAAEVLQNDAIPERFPDGIIFYSFYGKPDPALALAHIVVSFGDEARPTLNDAARRVLAGKRVLLVLDGAEEAADLQAMLGVRGDQCGVLVTSQNNEDAPGEWQDIDRLPPDDAVKLLQAWGKDQATDLTVVTEICKEVDGLPMALCLIGSYLSKKGEPASEYLAWLKADPIEVLSHGKHRRDNIERLVEHSLDQVSKTAQQVLGVAGLLALASFDRDVVGAALNRSGAGLGRPLGQLVSYGLLRREGDRYWASHTLIYRYAQRRLVVPAEGLERVAGYYVAFADKQSQQGLAGYARLDAEREHTMRVLVGCIEQERWAVAIDLVWALDGYLDFQGHIVENQAALECGVIAARQLGDRHNEGGFLGSLGVSYRDLGQVERAIEIYEQALTITREIGDRKGEGHRLSNLGIAYFDLGQGERAVEYHEQALAIAREIGDRRDEGVVLGNLGVAYYSLAQVERAAEYHEQGLAIAREIRDRKGEGHHLSNLGIAYFDLGQEERAAEYVDQALAIARETGNRRAEGLRAWNLGLLYEDTDPAHAVALMSILVNYECEIGHPDAETHAERVAKLRARLADDKEAGL